MTPLTLEQMEKAILKLAELAESEYGDTTTDCGGDFGCPVCIGCYAFYICQKLTEQKAILQELAAILEGEQ